jgi:3-dehydroquinate synthase
MKSIRVTLPGHRHEILVEPGLTGLIPKLLKDRGLSDSVFVVTSPRIQKLYHQALTGAWPGDMPPPVFLQVPEGESSKSLEMASRLYTRLIRQGADRSAVVVALGGGVIGDLAGFVAATYLRGIRFVQVPTTLLAQIDSSIGGKVGINHELGKNLIGAFHQPSLVLSDPSLLLTLAEREWHSGLFEAVKYGIISSSRLFAFIESRLEAIRHREMDAITRLIVECAAIKARVISKDEKESGLRMILNFGHTVGHALEAACGYGKLRHGEAVGWGMLFAIEYSERKGLTSSRAARRMRELICALGLPRLPRLRSDEILASMEQDKKRRGRVLRLVVPSRIGRVSVVEAEDRESIRAALRGSGIVR